MLNELHDALEGCRGLQVASQDARLMLAGVAHLAGMQAEQLTRRHAEVGQAMLSLVPAESSTESVDPDAEAWQQRFGKTRAGWDVIHKQEEFADGAAVTVVVAAEILQILNSWKCFSSDTQCVPESLVAEVEQAAALLSGY